MVSEIQVLNEIECGNVRTAVHDCKHTWIRRELFAPFYTLAIASYIDAKGTLGLTYGKRAQSYNTILRDTFQPLYARVAEALTDELKAPIEYDQRFAIPGFHIFQAHETFGLDRGSVHCDLQYALLDWEQKIPEAIPISFTLTIALPQAGAGLWVWDLTQPEIAKLNTNEIKQLAARNPKTFHAYSMGKMVIHSGHQVHQIAPMPDMVPGDERLTLQGHGLLVDGVWRLYW